MWFWMNKVVRIRTHKGILLVWILNSYCFDHDDVTWYSSKEENYGNQRGGEKKMRWGSFREEQEVLKVENHRFYFNITQILIIVLGFFSTKYGIML
jgi:hypothetical protein